jgi:hypothetical protein
MSKFDDVALGLTSNQNCYEDIIGCIYFLICKFNSPIEQGIDRCNKFVEGGGGRDFLLLLKLVIVIIESICEEKLEFI